MAQSRTLSFIIPCGKGGLNRMGNYLDFPMEDLAWSDGITSEHNAWEKEAGASKFNTVGTVLTNTSQDWTVAVTSNVVTVNTINTHFFLPGYTFSTNATFAANTFMNSLSGKTVLTVPTATTFTFALTQGNQSATTETAATATMTPTPLAVTAIHDTWNSSAIGSPTVPGPAFQKLCVFHKSSVGSLTTYNTSGGFVNSQNLAITVDSIPWVVDCVIRDVIKSQMVFFGNAPMYFSVPESFDWSGLISPSTDWSSTGQYPHYGFSHNFRVVCFTKYSSILYMSSPSDHTKFASSDANTRIMDVYPGEGNYMAAGASWRGRAYLLKYPLGAYYVDDSDSNIANWRTIKVTDAIGGAGPGCMVAYEDDVIILASDGYFYSLSDVQTLGQRSVKPILPNELGDFIRGEINTGRLDLVRSTYYSRKRQIWFQLPGTGGTTLNRRLIFDASIPGKIRIMWSERDDMTCLATRRESNILQPVWGTSTGQVYVGDKAARNKDSAGYTSQFETPPYELFPADDRFANLEELHTTFKPEGDYDLTLEVQLDDAVSQTLTLSQQSTGSPTGSISLDADVLAGGVIATTVSKLDGEARRVRLIGKNNEEDENFAVQQFNIRHKPGRHGTV